jgi:hypothetical protein
MLNALRARLDYATLPADLRRYVVATSIAGFVVPIALLAARPVSLDGHAWLVAVVLTAFAALAESRPLHLTHKTSINLAATVYLAMLILLPWRLPAALALIGAGIGQTSRLRTTATLGVAEPLFNAGQAALYVASAGAVAGAMPWLGERTGWGRPSEWLLMGAASAVIHLVNTGLVAGAAARQMELPAGRIWRRNLGLDLGPHLALTVLAAAAVQLTRSSIILLPALAAPIFLVHRAVAQTVQLRADTREALASLVEVIELRDPYTAGHSRRVAATARTLAFALGLTAEEADVIESAGRVHDLGKVAMDPAILLKTSQLDADEWTQMKLHPVRSADVVDRFAAYKQGSAMVRHHHEAWDGSGYPDGLAGEAIPLGARILAVADTLDALTSDRPYRRGLPEAKARAILRDGAGRQWDPRVVAALLAPENVAAGLRELQPSAAARAATQGPARDLNSPTAPAGAA